MQTETKLLSGALGAEIKGIDLTDISDENFKKINDLLLEHKVIFFRDQPLTAEQHIALAEKFGPLETHAYVKGLENYPEIVRIIKAEDEKNQWGENWHSDVSYNFKPTKAVILKSLKIPPVGGDTCFSNMELAWETLDEKIKEKIKDKRAIHSSLGAEFFLENYKKMEGNKKKNYDEYSSEHPVVRTHPISGKEALYVNDGFVGKIVELSDSESKALLKMLYDHVAYSVNIQCRVRWEPNTVVFWDNRIVQHHAAFDYSPSVRKGYRATIQGEVPTL